MYYYVLRGSILTALEVELYSSIVSLVSVVKYSNSGLCSRYDLRERWMKRVICV